MGEGLGSRGGRTVWRGNPTYSPTKYRHNTDIWSFQDDGALFARLLSLAAILQEMWDRVRRLLKGEGIAEGKSKAACLNAAPRFHEPSAAGYADPFIQLPVSVEPERSEVINGPNLGGFLGLAPDL